jgi:hypothetical protein
MEPEASKTVGWARQLVSNTPLSKLQNLVSVSTSRKESQKGEVSMSPPLLKQTVVQSSDAELESLDSSLMERTQLNVSNFNLAIYIGLVHAGLVLCILIFYSVSQLLKDYWKPIRWAILLSMPLRKVQGEVVHFWETPLQNGFLETVIAIPQATTHAVKESVADACEALLEMCGKRAPFPRHIGFVKLSQWLLTFTLFILGYEFLGPTYMGAIIVLMFSSQAALGQIMSVFGVAIELSPTAAPQVERRSSLAQLYEFTVQPLVRMTRYGLRHFNYIIASHQCSCFVAFESLEIIGVWHSL